MSDIIKYNLLYIRTIETIKGIQDKKTDDKNAVLNNLKELQKIMIKSDDFGIYMTKILYVCIYYEPILFLASSKNQSDKDYLSFLKKFLKDIFTEINNDQERMTQTIGVYNNVTNSVNSLILDIAFVSVLYDNIPEIRAPMSQLNFDKVIDELLQEKLCTIIFLYAIIFYGFSCSELCHIYTFCELISHTHSIDSLYLLSEFEQILEIFLELHPNLKKQRIKKALLNKFPTKKNTGNEKIKIQDIAEKMILSINKYNFNDNLKNNEFYKLLKKCSK